MPKAVLLHTPDGADVTTTAVTGPARQLVPGIEPGGSRAGKATKRALLIRDAWIQIVNMSFDGGVDQVNGFTMDLKLSQENDMTPGLLLPIGQVAMDFHEATAVARTYGSVVYNNLFHEQGTIWAPRFVATRYAPIGLGFEGRIDVHLLYDVIEVPWRDWLIMWEFLDGVPDNSREY